MYILKRHLRTYAINSIPLVRVNAFRWFSSLVFLLLFCVDHEIQTPNMHFIILKNVNQREFEVVKI